MFMTVAFFITTLKNNFVSADARLQLLKEIRPAAIVFIFVSKFLQIFEVSIARQSAY